MANELKLVGYTPAQTVTVQILTEDLVPVGSLIATTEPETGMYMGSVPGGTAAGSYIIAFYDGSDIIADGELEWSGTEEVEPGGNTILSTVNLGSTGTLHVKAKDTTTLKVGR